MFACCDVISQDNSCNHSRLRLVSSLSFLLFVLAPLLPVLLPCRCFLFLVTTSKILQIAQLVAYSATIFLMVCTWLKNPGYIPTPMTKQERILELVQEEPKVEPRRICPDCLVILHMMQILKPPRSKHCEICKSCVKVYDHHCPFLNNCIGAGNYFFYCILLLAAATCFGIVTYLGIRGTPVCLQRFWIQRGFPSR